MNESGKSYTHVDLWKDWPKPSDGEMKALELRMREEQDKFEAAQDALPPKNLVGIEMMKSLDDMVVDEELDILVIDEDITLEERKRATEIFNAAKYRGDVTPFFRYLDELRHAPEAEREKAQKLLRVFEVAEHYFMHHFPLEHSTQKGDAEVIENVQFDEAEFMALFAEEDSRGLDLEGEDAFFEEHGPYPSAAFFSSKYNTQSGIMAAFQYLHELDERITQEVSKFPAHDEPSDAYRLMFGSLAERNEDQIWTDYISPEAEWEHTDFATKGMWDRFYAQRAFLFKCLSRVGDQSAIDYCLHYFEVDDSSTFRNEIADVCSIIDPGYAAQRIAEVLRSKKKFSRFRRYDYSRMLYRLELGRIGISEAGLRYFDKRFDLGEWSNQKNSARRVSPNGDIGVVDEHDMLQGIFNVGDLTEKSDEVVRVQVLEIVKDMLFTPRADETEKDRALRESILQEFKQKYNSFYDDSFLEKTGIHINNLPLKEQGWFMHFVQRADEETQKRAYAFVKTHGEDGFRTFLAAEYGDEIGGRILELGEALGPEHARALFALYGTTLDNAEALRSKLQAQERMGGKDDEQLRRLIDQTHEALVRRSKDLILAAHEIGVRKQQETDLTLAHVQVALSGMNLLLELLHGLDSDGGYTTDLVQTMHERDYTVLKYRIVGPDGYEYGLKLLARPEETRHPDGSVQAEARVNIELDFDTVRPNRILKEAFYTNTEFPEQKKCVERHTLRLGIDRDTHYEGGRVSLDLGRGDHVSDTLSRQGDVVGRLLQLVSDEGSHNTGSFDKEFADPTVFKQLVELLVSRLTHAS